MLIFFCLSHLHYAPVNNITDDDPGPRFLGRFRAERKSMLYPWLGARV